MIAQKQAEAQALLEKQIQKAEVKQVESTLPTTKKYVKCICSKCGEVFYIDFNKIVIVEM